MFQSKRDAGRGALDSSFSISGFQSSGLGALQNKQRAALGDLLGEMALKKGFCGVPTTKALVECIYSI